MNRKSIHQNLMRTAETLAGMNMTRWAVTLAVVMITMLALPTGAWAQDPATGEIEQNGGEVITFTGYNIPFTIALYDNGQQKENNVVGTASANPSYVDKAYIQVTITATANEGYKFREWQTRNPSAIDGFSKNQSSFSFTHPSSQVSFTAVFEVDPDYQGGSGQTGTNDSPNIQPENPDQPANPSQPVNPDQPVSGGVDENTVYPLGAGVMEELESGNTTIGESGKTIHYQVEAGGFTIKTGQTLRIVGNIVIDIPDGRKITLEPGTDLILEVGNSLTFNGQGKLEGGGTITNDGTITFNEGTVDLTGTGSKIVNNWTTNIKCKNFSVSKIQGGTLKFNQGAVSYLYFGELEVNDITIDSSCSYFYNFDIYNKPVAGKLLRVDRYPWLPDDSKENSSYIATKDGMYLSSNNSYTNVYLVGRTFHRDGKWHTICLPFNYKKDVSFSGTIIRPLTNASISGTTLALTFGAPVTEMEAGVPYIVKWDVTEPSTITDPYILGQMVSKAMQNYDNGVSGAGRVRFIGTYDAIDYDTEDKSILLFDDDNKLYFPENGTHIGGFRGYFKIGEDGTEPSKVTAFKMNFSDEPGVDHDAVVIVPDAEVTPEPERRLLSLGKGWNAHGAVTASYIIEGMTEAEDITENLTVESAFPVPEGATVTLTITPGEDYVVDKVTVTKVEPQEVIGGGFESRTRGDGDDAVVVSHTAGTDVWSFTMPAYDAEATVTYKEKTAQKKTIEAGWITVDVGGGLTYNGQEQKPGVTVTDGGTDITDEFVITYNNNKSAGEATVTVTAKSTSTGYTGSETLKFTIARKALELVADQKSITEGKELPTFTGSIKGFVGDEGLSATDELTFSVEGTPSAVGEYAVTGKLNGAASGNYGQNYTFDNAEANKTTFIIETDVKNIIKNPEQLNVGDEFTVIISNSPKTVNKSYSFKSMSGVTIDAHVNATLESSTGNKATYKVTSNQAEKLTFGEVEWKESGALIDHSTTLKNITFAGAAVNTANIKFTNIESLETDQKMILVASFGDAVGTITGTAFIVGKEIGGGRAYLEGNDLKYLATKGAGQTEEQILVDPDQSVEIDGIPMNKLSAKSQAALSGVTNASIAIKASDANRVHKISHFSGGAAKVTLDISKGSAVQVGVMDAQKGAAISLKYNALTEKAIAKARMKELAKSAKTLPNKTVPDPRAAECSRTRGAEDEMIEIESGEEYVVLQDGPLLLTFDVEEEPITIENITLEDPDPNDLNLDGDVNAADIVKAVSDGKTNAEIDAIVNAIMGK